MTEDQQYDPTADGETVEKVAAHLADADAAEVERVQALEAAGQDRSGVRMAADNRLAAIRAEAEGGAAKDTPVAGDGVPKTTEAPTFSEAAEVVPEAGDKAHQQGFYGTPPSRTGDTAVDLTFQAVTGQKSED